MAGIETFTTAVSGLVKALGNVVGIVEANANSAVSLADLNRERKILAALDATLQSLTRMNDRNHRTLWQIGRHAEHPELPPVRAWESEVGWEEVELFAQDIARIRFDLDAYATDLIAHDHNLYSDLERIIGSRVGIVQWIETHRSQISEGQFAAEMKELYVAYKDLVDALKVCKAKIQQAINTIREPRRSQPGIVPQE